METYLFLPIVFVVILGGITLIWLIVNNHNLKKSNNLLEKAFNQITPVCVTSTKYEIISANNAYWKTFGEMKDNNKKRVQCFVHRPGESCHTEMCPVIQIVKGKKEFKCEPKKESNGVMSYFIVSAKPYYGKKGEILGAIESFQDITELKKLEKEKSDLILELQESLAQVKVLSGLIPICARCKQIRDDRGFWNQVESYISEHSEVQFSHSVCPDCSRKLYPEIYE